ncbi:hypothetical protein AK830_g4459 [Neonectria ditissima]|uniref:PLL-like beta propeller domain-containing protein n=1 Tax=Neonectria ditissima TaxID=78410 RepID=A0A0P7BG14_9HYPO|nr:hypothetical protein AK830_g4459 [Neonectria ditissima]
MAQVSPEHVSDAPPQYVDVVASPPPAYVKNEPATNANPAVTLPTIETAPPKTLHRKKRPWILSAVVMLALIALTVGLCVRLIANQHKSNDPSNHSTSDDDYDDDSSPDPDDDHPRSLCSGTICPQVITTAEFGGRLHIFIRTADNHIAHNSGGRGKMAFEFPTTWHDLGATAGKIISQPAAIAWKLNGTPRLSIFASASLTTSQPVLCRVGDGADQRIDLWVTDADSHEIKQQSWDVDADSWAVDDGFADINGTGPARTAPAVFCRRNNVKHDVVWYGREDGGALWYRGYNSTSRKWEEPRDFGGKFLGDPALFTQAKRQGRLDFFGVQDNHEVYHFSRTDDEFSELESLGGNVTSTPSIVGSVTGLAGTFDMVALGSDGNTRHMYYDQTSQSNKWENIYLTSIGAPALAMHGRYTIVLLLLREDGIYWATTSAGGSWVGVVS